jgi:hypothetical protein
MRESAEEMARRLTAIAHELKSTGRDADAAAALAGTLAIYLDQHRADRSETPAAGRRPTRPEEVSSASAGPDAPRPAA